MSAGEKWVLEWPGQIVLCGSQIHWTTEVTKAIETDGGLKVGKAGDLEAWYMGLIVKSSGMFKLMLS